MFEGGWALIGFLAFCLLVWISKWFDWFGDSSAKKRIRGGRLIATKTFECWGRTIKKGTKGAKIGSYVEFDLYDNSWADKDTTIEGRSKITHDSYIENSEINSWDIICCEILNTKALNTSSHVNGMFSSSKIKGRIVKNPIGDSVWGTGGRKNINGTMSKEQIKFAIDNHLNTNCVVTSTDSNNHYNVLLNTKVLFWESINLLQGTDIKIENIMAIDKDTFSMGIKVS